MNKVKTGTNQYCGPAVLSILTGKSVDECSSIFASLRNSTIETKEITYDELKQVLTKLRYKFTLVDTDCSLYVAMMTVSSRPGFYIIGLPKHVAVLESTVDLEGKQKVFFCDNHTKEPIMGASSARMMQKVDKLIKVELKPEPKLLSSEVKVMHYQYPDKTSIIIKRILNYEDPEDNVERMLGHIEVSGAEELNRVIRELTIHWDGFND